MTPFFRKVQEDSNETGIADGNQSEHNPNWMLNREDPPILRRPGHSAAQNYSQEQGYAQIPPQTQAQTATYSQQEFAPPVLAIDPYMNRSGQQQPQQPLPQPQFHVPPQTIHAGSAQASFGSAQAPASHSNSGYTNSSLKNPNHSTDQIRQMGFLQDNFRDENREKDSIDEDDWNDRQSPLNFVILASLIIMLTVLGWFTYRWMTTSHGGEPPIIVAEDTPFKIKPDNPGGMIVPHQDKLVYGRLTPDSQQSAEHLLPQPEQPIALPQMEMQPQPYSDNGHYGDYGAGENRHPGYGVSVQQSGYAPQNQVNYGPPNPGNINGPQTAVPPYGPAGHQMPFQQGQQSHHGQQGQQPGAYPSSPQQGMSQNMGVVQQPYPQGMPQGNYGAPGKPYGAQPGEQPVVQPSVHPMAQPQNQSPQGYFTPPTQGAGSLSDQNLTPVAIPSQSIQGQSSTGITGQNPAFQSSGSQVGVAPGDGFEDENSEDDKKAQEALDNLVADEIAGKAPPKMAEKDLQVSSKTEAVVNGAYRLQVASFETESDAKNEIKRLRSLDPSLFKERKFIIQKSESSSTKKTLYKVMIGFFPSANATNQFKSKLKIHKVDGFVIKSKTESTLAG